ncbi:hypothetical protein [Streptomyces sp. NPDC001500]
MAIKGSDNWYHGKLADKSESGLSSGLTGWMRTAGWMRTDLASWA